MRVLSVAVAMVVAVSVAGVADRGAERAAATSSDELAGAAAGHPAVVVSAGPSLRRNIDRLAATGVVPHPALRSATGIAGCMTGSS